MNKVIEPSPPTTGPLRIDGLTLPQGGVLGMCHCPGRNGIDAQGRVWRRDLRADLDSIEAWGASILLTLVEAREFATLGVPEFAAASRGRRFAWHHVPVPDMQPPQPASLLAWQVSGTAVADALHQGQRVVVHCAAGLGRTGTIAALLLTTFGAAPAQAILRVRAARPGTLETAEQEAFVHAPRAWRLPARPLIG